MKTKSSNSSKLADWLKKNTEGDMLMQWISYFMIFTVLLLFILAYPVEQKLDWRFYTTVLMLAVLLLTNILWFQSEHLWIDRFGPKVSLWIINIFTTLLVLGAFALTGRGEVIFLLFMQAAQFAITMGVWPAGMLYCVVTLGAALGILTAYGTPPNQLVQVGAQFMAGMIFVEIITLLQTRSETEKKRAEGLLKELQAANFELKAAQQKEKELAIAEERMRMARDIHDGLGHHLTVLSIQLQAADKLVERNPQAAAEAIRTSREEARAALEEVRNSVSVMRETSEESQPLDLMLRSLVQSFDEHTGLKSDFQCSGSPYDLSSFARQTIFRAVQESLTNIQKHGKGVSHIQVDLEYSPETIHLSVSDDGEKPGGELDGQAGFGLQGLKERVDQLGGEFCCGPGKSRGFLVDVTIPVHEVSGDPSLAGG
jgi:signal transduction histidine kinase